MAQVVDTGTEFGAHVAARLDREEVVWLTTVGHSGTPQPNPVWFLWDGDEVLILSKPGQAKVRNVTANPRVSLNLNSTGEGGEVAVLTGRARIDAAGLGPAELDAYTKKYREPMTRIGYTPEGFYPDYSTLIRITPERLRGF
ncbi:TIGR03667 family PPOX class F420-dependent oxidoreductase [Nocardia pseudobrasiliensis]|uniref:PPOX class probable F420-dependent enzyme n=1 Tax=Nocardia pseudobrasiliensis TaxID=45979 RepID=A0A370I1G8_9NOCA|nr:TIGR03667 family PPOX class F420-dependent oxidoreductase [Nocardia pseudobrasiliensis]RDI64576.1 PPOX class probable F420-dependent enzyme [Nocardia pseudobrasiliensis]